jgi:hypothetical protein
VSMQSEATVLVSQHKDNIENILKYGNPVEKAMVQVVLNTAAGDCK